MALPAAHRLTAAPDISRAISAGRRGRSGPFVVHCRPTSDQLGARFAFALPRSVGTAVARNVVRRRIQGLVQDWSHGGQLVRDVHVVVRVLPGAAGLSTATIRGRVEPLLLRCGALSHPGDATGRDAR